MLEHIEDDNGELARAARFLAKGGALVVLCPAFQVLFSAMDTALGHFRRYTARTLAAVFPRELRRREVFYLDSLGMVASLANKFVLRQDAPGGGQVKFWDGFIIPISRVLDRLVALFRGAIGDRGVLQAETMSEAIASWDEQWREALGPRLAVAARAHRAAAVRRRVFAARSPILISRFTSPPASGSRSITPCRSSSRSRGRDPARRFRRIRGRSSFLYFESDRALRPDGLNVLQGSIYVALAAVMVVLGQGGALESVGDRSSWWPPI